MARKDLEVTEEVLVELLIRIEGSAEINRIATFKLPLVGREVGDDDTAGVVRFESKTLVKRIKVALDALLR